MLVLFVYNVNCGINGVQLFGSRCWGHRVWEKFMVAWSWMGRHVRRCIVRSCALRLSVDVVVGMVHRCGMGVCGIVSGCLPV